MFDTTVSKENGFLLKIPRRSGWQGSTFLKISFVLCDEAGF